MRRAVAALGLVAALTGCVPARKPIATVELPPAVANTPTAPRPQRAIELPLTRAVLASIDAGQAQAALVAFKTSCASLTKRTDRSGLTQPDDWKAACAGAARADDATVFFKSEFVPLRVGEGRAFVTGYYEPEIAGARNRDDQNTVPVYRLPPDLVKQSYQLCGSPDTASPQTCQTKIASGRWQDGKLIPYYDRSQIDGGALAGRGLELAWAADAVELFFLEIQGSGRLRLPDGSVLRIGYAGQNGLPYTGIGTLMKQRGLLPPGQASMQSIVAALRAQPDGGRSIMQENRSYVFFRELTGAGPLGALGLPVTPRVSLAGDPAFVPLGAPVWLSTDRGEVGGLWIVQDTGGAIKGANRFDSFWGAGDAARTIAGGMLARGDALILLPRVSAERLLASARP